jgi:hypothetical protein
MESIQWITPEGSPLVALAQQGVEMVNIVVAQRSADNPRGEPSIGNGSGKETLKCGNIIDKWQPLFSPQ